MFGVVTNTNMKSGGGASPGKVCNYHGCLNNAQTDGMCPSHYKMNMLRSRKKYGYGIQVAETGNTQVVAHCEETKKRAKRAGHNVSSNDNGMARQARNMARQEEDACASGNPSARTGLYPSPKKRRRIDDDDEFTSSAEGFSGGQQQFYYYKPLAIEPCTIRQLEDRIALLQTEVEEYQELINLKSAEIEHARGRIEYFKNMPTSESNIIELKHDLRKIISDSLDSKITSFGPRDGTLQSSLKEMKKELIGRIDCVDTNNNTGFDTEDDGEDDDGEDNDETEEPCYTNPNQLDQEQIRKELGGREYSGEWYNGSLKPLPSSWRYPKRCTVIQLINLWLIGIKELNVPPLYKLLPCHVYHFDENGRCLSKFRVVMDFVKFCGQKRGAWVKPNEWNEETLKKLWCAIQPDFDPFMRTPTQMMRNNVNSRSYYKSLHGDVACTTVHGKLSAAGLLASGKSRKPRAFEKWNYQEDDHEG